MSVRDLDSRLCQALCEHPRQYDNKYSPEARNKLLEILFRSLTNDRLDYLAELFPNGFQSYSLQEAQGALEETEYTEAARGHPCGHILRPGEGTYRCATCTSDPTVVLCARCFAASDHEGHQYDVTISTGNSGCCDCGDEEAWRRPVKCAIHSARDPAGAPATPTETETEPESALPADLYQALRVTIARALDYFCDIISCCPENLRATKTAESVKQDELRSRLSKTTYVSGDDIEANPEYNLVMWNDEKHTMEEVQDQVARACRTRERVGLAKAEEANDIGRSIVSHSRNLTEMLRQAKIIEEIKVTVTVRAARDTFREQMCGTILEWLSDIAGCVIKGNGSILRQIICEEMLGIWRTGSQAFNVRIGREGLTDNEKADRVEYALRRFPDTIQILLHRNQQLNDTEDDEEMDEDNDGADLVDGEEDDDDEEDDDYEQIDSRMALSMIEQNETGGHRAPGDITSDGDEMDTDGDMDFPDAASTLR